MTAELISCLARHCSLRISALVALLVTWQLPTALAEASLQVPSLSSNTEIATAGLYRLSWQTNGIAQVELQEADNPDFADARLDYQGPDDTSVISRKPNGTWYYRARVIGDQQAGPWSAAVKVTVAHHPLYRAFMFFGLGVVVFVATLLLGGTPRGKGTR
jgi:protein-S-isoprenylcysteine O-methyltransferase Ste14